MGFVRKVHSDVHDNRKNCKSNKIIIIIIIIIINCYSLNKNVSKKIVRIVPSSYSSPPSSSSLPSPFRGCSSAPLELQLEVVDCNYMKKIKKNKKNKIKLVP